ncbi:MAG TPA: ADOP family duplicated permease [Gemmatimonadaceae bacterium]|nr:ADOP family duplicated permease [Gemmatimonadaceae bacterium]
MPLEPILTSIAGALRRVRLLLTRDRAAADLESEMRLHLDLRAARYHEQGMPDPDARLAARKRFGNPLALQERSRDEWGLRWLEQLWQDVRYGARMLRRSPGFAAIAIGAVGIAVGVNAGFFTLVDTFAWQPLPVSHPERLVQLSVVDARGVRPNQLTYVELGTIAAHARTLEDVIGYAGEPIAVKASPARPASSTSLGLVTGNYFAALGATARAGRLLAPSDDRADGAPVVVISDAYWTAAFARAPGIVGHDIVVNGTHATIVGVAAPDFAGVIPLVPDMWMTFAQADRVGATPGRLLDPANRYINAYARLRRGFTMAQSAAELSGLVAAPPRSATAQDSALRIVGAALRPRKSLLPATGQIFVVLAPALLLVGLVLVIACSNLANLLLSRALVRQREIAVRLAMGASRNRLVRQLLTESTLVAVAGGVLGFALSAWTVTAVSRSYFRNSIPPQYGTLMLAMHPSWHVVAYTILLAAVSVLTFGVAPALHATSPNLGGMLKGDDGAGVGRVRRSRVRDALIVAQVAGSVVLIAAAAILVRGVRRVASASAGLEPDRVSLVSFGLAPVGRLTPLLAAERATFGARVAHTAGVVTTARSSTTPYSTWPFTRVRAGASSDAASTRALPINRVTPGYFDVLGQRIVQGRAFTAADSATNAPVAIVTQSAARTLWPHSRAVGQALRMIRNDGEPGTVVQIVGVAADARSGMLWDDDATGYLYRPATDSDFAGVDMPLLVRSTIEPPVLARSLRDIAASIDPNTPLDVTALTTIRDQQLVPFRYAATITGAIAALGLGLAIIGLYGVVAFAVQQRRREIAVHVAMGAGPRAVLRLVMRREMRLVGVGLLCGLVLALGESGLINSLTLPLPGLGVVGLAGVAVLLLAVAATAIVLPARAALRIAPMQVLRQE